MGLNKYFFFGVIFLLVALRLWLGAIIPLTESTEARYGEVARLMLETGNWINLMFSKMTVFWGKPPLYAWLSAFSMSLFGVSELAARLPSMLLCLLVAWLVYGLALTQLNKEKAVFAVMVLFTGIGFIAASGTVMTDACLLISVTLGICGWWRYHHSRELKWALQFSAGVGLGLLAKGPVAVVLIGLPIFCYALIYGNVFKILRALPWRWLLLLGVFLPSLWYLLAELRSPGFLRYFLLGENFQRFIDPGWQGDLYGSAHKRQRGTILIYAAIALLPWSFYALGGLAMLRRNSFARLKQNPFRFFLLLWMLSHLLFFSLSANVIWPYYLPMVPAFALFFADIFGGYRKLSHVLVYLSSCLILGSLLLAGYRSTAFPEKYIKSGKNLVQLWHEQQPLPDSQFYYLSWKRQFSLEFYSGGRASMIGTYAEAMPLLDNKTRDSLLVWNFYMTDLPEVIKEHFTVVEDGRPGTMRMVLLRENAP
jgi:4-amino-4-deoxy-L-arabinose transferase-like glycosyltransferase